MSISCSGGQPGDISNATDWVDEYIRSKNSRTSESDLRELEGQTRQLCVFIVGALNKQQAKMAGNKTLKNHTITHLNKLKTALRNLPPDILTPIIPLEGTSDTLKSSEYLLSLLANGILEFTIEKPFDDERFKGTLESDLTRVQNTEMTVTQNGTELGKTELKNLASFLEQQGLTTVSTEDCKALFWRNKTGVGGSNIGIMGTITPVAYILDVSDSKKPILTQKEHLKLLPNPSTSKLILEIGSVANICIEQVDGCKTYIISETLSLKNPLVSTEDGDKKVSGQKPGDQATTGSTGYSSDIDSV